MCRDGRVGSSETTEKTKRKTLRNRNREQGGRKEGRMRNKSTGIFLRSRPIKNRKF